MNKLMLIINPVAGKKQAPRQLVKLIRTFMDFGWQVTTYVTGAKGEAMEFAARDGASFDRIICSGGDGTLNEVVRGLVRADLSVPVGYLPSGSTNDFAEFLHISPRLPTAAKRAAGGDIRKIDVCRFGDRCFLNIAAFGVFSDLSYTTPQYLKNLLGLAGYVIDGIKDLSTGRPQQLRLRADGKVYEGSYIFGAVCNASGIGELMDVPMEADDGEMNVLLIRMPENFLEQQLILHALQNKEYDSPYFDCFKASSLVLECDAPMDWALDGEHAILEEKTEIRCLRQRLQMVL